MTQLEATAVAKQLYGEDVLVVRKPIEGTPFRKWSLHPSFLGELFVPGLDTAWWVFSLGQLYGTSKVFLEYETVHKEKS